MTKDEFCQLLEDKYKSMSYELAAQPQTDGSVNVNAFMLRGRLDLIQWVMELASNIEVPKTKMREFL